MNNFFKKSKIFILLIILLCLYIFLSAYSYVNLISNDLRNNVFRLHVIANSNSEEDQNLKYVVRDNLIKYMNSICDNISSKEEAIKIVSSHLTDFTNIANKTIKESGFSYNANVEIGNFNFPTKTYADISFPSGYYDALKVKIGKAEGQNWWCVLYPALCFVDVTSGFVPKESKEELENNLTSEEYQLISEKNNPTINFKFKLIEFFTQKNLITAKNQ